MPGELETKLYEVVEHYQGRVGYKVRATTPKIAAGLIGEPYFMEDAYMDEVDGKSKVVVYVPGTETVLYDSSLDPDSEDYPVSPTGRITREGPEIQAVKRDIKSLSDTPVQIIEMDYAHAEARVIAAMAATGEYLDCELCGTPINVANLEPEAVTQDSVQCPLCRHYNARATKVATPPQKPASEPEKSPVEAIVARHAIPGPFNKYQTAAIRAYDMRHRPEDDTVDVDGDPLARFILLELSNAEGCGNAAEALDRMRSLVDQAERVKSVMQVLVYAEDPE